MVGVFHFANPGKDRVKTWQINVMTDAVAETLTPQEISDGQARFEFSSFKLLMQADHEKIP